MPLATPRFLHSGPLTRARSTVAHLLLLVCCAPGAHASRGKSPEPSHSSAIGYDQALRMREALEGRPQQQRTRREYDRALDAFRAVYRADPRSSHADASVIAVAELLAAEGRLFQDRKISLASISEYEFLRREYPASRYRSSALLTEAEIYDHDLGDAGAARSIFTQFVRQYPQNPLAEEARQALRRGPPAAVSASRSASRPSNSSMAAVTAPMSKAHGSHHNAVLDAALASQQTARSPSEKTQPSAPGGTSLTQPAHASGASPHTGGTLVERDLPASPLEPAAPDPGLRSTPANASPASAADARTPEPRSGPAPASQVSARLRQPQQGSGSSDDLSKTQAAPPLPSAATLNEAALNAPPPPPRRGGLPLVTGVRHWSTPVYTRVAIDLDVDQEVKYEASRAPNPDRIFFDLHGAKLSPELIGKAITVTDGGYLKRIRAAQFSGDVVRVVLDVSDVSGYSAFFLPNPSRLIIDIHGNASGPTFEAGASSPASRPATPAAMLRSVPVRRIPPSPASAATVAPVQTRPHTVPPLATQASGTQIADGGPKAQISPPALTPTNGPALADPSALHAHNPAISRKPADALGDIATLGTQPDTVRATHSPTTAPVSASVADTTPAPQPSTVLTPAPDRHTRSLKTARTHGITPADTAAPPIHAPDLPAAAPARAAAPTSNGERSMVRALGLKIGRIVVDAGHGGHDSGTLGPGGIEEKDVVLDVALRLGRLLKQRLGADVIYTRDDDTFIPLETRTAIANKAQADLFLSVHANSSPDASARGVETYYLNFTSSADALEVAARENAVSNQSIHQLSDLVKKITLQDKIAESREFASDVEQSLYTGLEPGNPGLKDRGVKKAPFVVLIGANMPSILAEISFLTNPDDAHQLRDPEYRQRIAESLYRGVAKYIGSLSGVRLAESSSRPAGQ